jgi:hypothetical protein
MQKRRFTKADRGVNIALSIQGTSVKITSSQVNNNVLRRSNIAETDEAELRLHANSAANRRVRDINVSRLGVNENVAKSLMVNAEIDVTKESLDLQVNVSVLRDHQLEC